MDNTHCNRGQIVSYEGMNQMVENHKLWLCPPIIIFVQPKSNALHKI